MRITELDSQPIHSLRHLTAVGAGVQEVALPFLRASVAGLPDNIDALLATSDLQGRAFDGRLLGVAVAEELAHLADRGQVPPGDRCGVLLAGDLYSASPPRRGASGDVRAVWQVFANWARWVCGVAGNHDLFSDKPDAPALAAFRHQSGGGLLDAETTERDGLRIAGLSGIIGRPGRPWRRSEAHFIEAFAGLVAAEPDILLCHEGPGRAGREQGGVPMLDELLVSARREILCVRGHMFWQEALLAGDGPRQVLNVDSRVVILQRI